MAAKSSLREAAPSFPPLRARLNYRDDDGEVEASEDCGLYDLSLDERRADGLLTAAML